MKLSRDEKNEVLDAIREYKVQTREYIRLAESQAVRSHFERIESLLVSVEKKMMGDYLTG